MPDLDPIPVHRTARTACTKCGWKLNAAGDPNDTRASPRKDDLGVCIECGHVMIYTRDRHLRDLTEAEKIEVAGDPDLSADLGTLSSKVAGFIEATRRELAEERKRGRLQ